MLGNDSIIFLLKLVNFKHILVSLLFLLPLFSSQGTQRKLYNNPYISLVLIGEGDGKSTISYSSFIRPSKIYLTETNEELTFGEEKNCPININTGLEENNITMEFTKNDIDLSGLFQYLNNIKKVDLTHFTNKVNDTSYMFYQCSNLEEVIMGSLNTLNVRNMAGMFQNTKITSLDFSRIKTKNVYDMNNMFNLCTNLKYLNFKNCNFKSLFNTNQMFGGLQNSLIFIDIYSLKDKDNFDKIFFNLITNKLIYCINEEEAPNFSATLKSKGFILNCSYLSSEEAIYDEDTEESLTGEYLQESSYIEEIKVIKEIKEITYTIPKTYITNTINCSSEEIFNRKCQDLNTNTTLTVEDKDNIITNLMNDIINGNLNSLLDDIVEGDKDDLILAQDDISFQVTTTENQNINEYNNISTIHLGNCETILKNIYGIPFNVSLIILKVDYFMEEFKFPVIGYEVFDPINKTKLNLSYCDNETVNYNIPIDIKEEDLEKYNASSDYYNDECSVYTTDDGTDIIILDRKKEFNDNNYYLCENDCNYTDYNSTSKKSVCMCEVKSKIYSISEIINNKDSLSQSFNVNDSSISSSNLGLMKCIDTLFSKYGLLKNLENYILIIMIFLYAGSAILYYRIGSSLLESDIAEILDNKFENEKKNKEIEKKNRKSIKSQKKKEENDVSNPKKKKRKSSLHTKKLNKGNKLRKSITINKKDLDINVGYDKSLSIFKLKNNSNNNLPHGINDSIIAPNLNDYELNTLPYNEALLYDKRDILGIYFSILRRNHPLLFSFIPNGDYNTMVIKLDIFILKFGICSAINALFFTESTIHKIYADRGAYKLGFYLPKILLSFLFTHVIIIILKYIFLSEGNILNVKKKPTYDEANEEADKAKRCLIIKYILFYIIGTAFLVLFWFYLSSFCAVYQNTQIFLIINTFISLGISFLYPCIINFLPSILRKVSLNNTNIECMYKTSKVLQII